MDLDQMNGILALGQDFGSGNVSIMRALRAGVHQFCTPFYGAPQSFKHNLVRDEELLAAITRNTCVFSADAASDEQVAAKEAERTALLPNLKYRNRDRAHASRRVVQRPWFADTYFTDIYVRFVGKLSFMHTIQHSYVQKLNYQEHQGALPERILLIQRDLSLARHRFDSCSKPLAVECLTMHALTMTAVQAYTEHKHEVPGKSALRHLQSITGPDGLERCLQLAMLGDACDEGLQFTRFNDSERADPAELEAQIATFLKRIKLLFIERQALHTGLTKFMLKLLKHELLWWEDGCPRKVGAGEGVPQIIIDRTFARMCCWVKLVVRVLQSEYPTFDVLLSFNVFRLDGIEFYTDEEVACTRDLHFLRLSKALGLDCGTLRAEYDKLRPIAQHLSKSTGRTALECWREALRMTHRSRHNYPEKQLRPALAFWAGWSFSTSGVEQNFSLRLWLHTPRQGFSPQSELDVLTISACAVADDAGMMTICELARNLWPKIYGIPRTSKLRLRGWKRKSRDPTFLSIDRWTKKRRTDVGETLTSSQRGGTMTLAEEYRDVAARADERASVMWTTKHEKEATRQVAEKQLRLIEAHRRGQTLFIDANLVVPDLDALTAWKKHDVTRTV